MPEAMCTNGDDVEQGEVLWIGPDVCCFPDFPDGFAFRVVDFFGPGGVDARGVRLVWVRGPLLDPHGVPHRVLQLCVPVDQPRAVQASYPQPRQYVTGPDGRRYRRAEFPTR